MVARARVADPPTNERPVRAKLAYQPNAGKPGAPAETGGGNADMNYSSRLLKEDFVA